MTAAEGDVSVGSPQGTGSTSVGEPVRLLRRKQAWKPWEILFWLVAIAVYFIFPSKLLLMSEIAILGIFALSLDLLLGYAGIVSLGHAAFFGLGAYAAGLFAMHVSAAPLLGLLAGAIVAGLIGFASSFLVLRGSDLTRLMVTLGVSLMLLEAANQAAWLTGGADGLPGMTIDPVLGLFDFDLFGRTAYLYSLCVLFTLFVIARRLVGSPFGLSLKAIKGNLLRTQSLGIRANRRLVAIYTISSIYAGIAGALLTQTTQFVSLDVLSFQRSADGLLVLVIGGSGYLYGGLIGAVIFKFLQDWISEITAEYWLFWLGLILVVIVLLGRDRLVAGPRLIVSSISRWYSMRTGA
jgi:branched-chain amino acid transport system permease protein